MILQVFDRVVALLSRRTHVHTLRRHNKTSNIIIIAIILCMMYVERANRAKQCIVDMVCRYIGI
jgi:hypothetical protein